MLHRLLLLVLLLSGGLFAQDRYAVYYAETLAGANLDVTIQKPANAVAEIRFEQIDVFCENGCTLQLRYDGTAATGTTQETITALSGTTTASLLAVWSGSNSASDTLIREFHVPAGVEYPIDFSKHIWVRSSGLRTLTLVSTATLTGDVSVFCSWGETR